MKALIGFIGPASAQSAIFLMKYPPSYATVQGEIVPMPNRPSAYSPVPAGAGVLRGDGSPAPLATEAVSKILTARGSGFFAKGLTDGPRYYPAHRAGTYGNHRLLQRGRGRGRGELPEPPHEKTVRAIRCTMQGNKLRQLSLGVARRRDPTAVH